MRNIRDWCISRQIWWGHRIPAWYCDACDRTIVARSAPGACPGCRGVLRQETDVLDTWFSSALWPFSTLGWPTRTPELAVYYPTACLVTGFDILFFWVARMMMMGLRFMGDVPFKDVVIHGLIRDEQGDKMSKTRGNVIDPLHVIHGATLEELLAAAEAGGVPPAALEGIRRQFPDGFPAFGADALRLTLTALAGLGSDVKLSIKRIEGYRHFCNKIWNAHRFLTPYIPSGPIPAMGTLPLTLADRWILSRLNDLIRGVSEALEGYRFNDAALLLYQFFWHEYCDWYLEIVKTRLTEAKDAPETRAGQAVLVHVLEQALRLLHPFMPFITEELWQRLPHQGESIMTAPWPQPNPALDAAEASEAMDCLMEIIREVRNIRSAYNVSPALKVPLVLRVPQRKEEAIVAEGQEYLTSLARLSRLHVSPDAAKPDLSATAVVKGVEIFVPLEEVIDLRAERERLSKDLGKLDQGLERIVKKLRNEEFVRKAPPAVVEKEKASRAELMEMRERLRENLTRIIRIETANNPSSTDG